MAQNDGALEYALELLGSVAPVRSKRMFGGHGIFVEDRMMALIAFEQLYLKVDDQTREAFEEAGSEPFTYTKKEGQTFVMSYMTAPDEALDDPDSMRPWAELAIAAARRAKPPARKKKKRS